jgi:hypothetical protein
LLENQSWLIRNDLFKIDPKFSNFTISGSTFELPDGIAAMALSQFNPHSVYDNRKLYFHSLSSDTENHVPLSVLNDAESFAVNEGAHAQHFKVIGKRYMISNFFMLFQLIYEISRKYQSVAEAMDSNGNLFFGLVGIDALSVWDSKFPYDERNIRVIARDPDKLEFLSGVKVIPNPNNQEELWIFSSPIQKFFLKTVDWSEINFRIQVGLISDILTSYNNAPLSVIERIENVTQIGNKVKKDEISQLSPNYEVQFAD